jgi:hypothetical protein
VLFIDGANLCVSAKTRTGVKARCLRIKKAQKGLHQSTDPPLNTYAQNRYIFMAIAAALITAFGDQSEMG